MHSALELEKNMQFAYIRIFLLGEYLYFISLNYRAISEI